MKLYGCRENSSVITTVLSKLGRNMSHEYTLHYFTSGAQHQVWSVVCQMVGYVRVWLPMYMYLIYCVVIQESEDSPKKRHSNRASCQLR